jgi:hypothetical protein
MATSDYTLMGSEFPPRPRTLPTPVIVRTVKRITQSMISAISNRGRMRFRSVPDRRHLKVHHASKVKTWAAVHALVVRQSE